MNDLPFDIFEPDKQPREQSAREKEHDEKISYRKYNNTGGVPCWDCIKQTQGVRSATVVRKQSGEESYLCGRHAQERRDGEALEQLVSKNDGGNPPPPQRGRKSPYRRRY